MTDAPFQVPPFSSGLRLLSVTWEQHEKWMSLFQAPSCMGFKTFSREREVNGHHLLGATFFKVGQRLLHLSRE